MQYPLYILLFAILFMLPSCQRVVSTFYEPDSPPFGIYQDSIDTLRIKHYLALEAQADSTPLQACHATRHYYDSLLHLPLQPLWYTPDDGVSPDAYETLDYLSRQLPAHALDILTFRLPQIAADLDALSMLCLDSLGLDINQVLARLDYNLTRAYTLYTTGMRYGFVSPSRLYNRLYNKSDNNAAFATLYAYATPPANYQEALRKIGTTTRMEYLTNSLPAFSAPYADLQRHLQQSTDSLDRMRTIANMERLRWRISHPDASTAQRNIIVNLPAQQLWATGADTVLSMKVAIGAWDTKTPLLHSQITYLQVNPEWSLPPKIAASDFTRHAGDSSWFARHKYFVVSRKSGDTLNIAHLSPEAFSNHTLRFVQHGGKGNALGRIVFRFSSNFSIYLHDTNAPYVFSRERRTVSHGCIRVERPYDLALYLLPDLDSWTLDCMRISMDMPPLTERGITWLEKHSDAPRPFRLFTYHKVSPPVPVFITYYTVFPNPSNGIVETYPDLYGYDAPLLRQLRTIIAN